MNFLNFKIYFMNFLNFKIYFMNFLLQLLPIFLDVRSRFSQTEITIGAGVVIVAIAHAITAMPEEPTPPAVDLCRRSATSSLATKYATVLVFDVLVTTRALLFLENRKIDYSKVFV